MGILAWLRLAKIRTMARPNSPDMPPKRTRKARLGIISTFSKTLPFQIVHGVVKIEFKNKQNDLPSHFSPFHGSWQEQETVSFVLSNKQEPPLRQPVIRQP